MQANVIATSGPRGRSRGRRRRAAARQDRHHHARQPPGQRLLPGARRAARPSWPRRAAGLAGRRNARRPQHRRCWPSRGSTCANASSRGIGAHFIPFTAQTRMSGVDLPAGRPVQRRHAVPLSQLRKGAADAVRKHVERSAAACRPRCMRAADDVARRGSTPLAVADGTTRARHRRAQGHRQGRHQGALRRAAPHGHQDGDGHRRQPAHRRGHRGRSRRRRLPGRSHARGQAGADPPATRPTAAWSR